ncbi:TonB-dependent receptor [Desulfoluna sp.]|uniref:TonB-dependent receptor n=1 Tax=Desulfoluna sp. TaxID=2045199 RepID=UPI0026309032|nr:TonB-dependent receptor [Desulfoluna sp.]
MELMQKILITGIACLTFTGLALAEPMKEIQLEEIVVAATKSGSSIRDIPASVTVLSHEDILQYNLPNGDVGDVLRSLPGITLRRAYAPFPSYPNIRGLGSDATVVLVNGIPTNWEITQAIPHKNVERIEILRGPASALYGANATGGVINIILKRGTENRETSLAVGYGRFDTLKLSGASSGKLNKFSYALAASHENSNGSRVVTNNLNPSITMLDGCEYDKQSFSMNTGIDLTKESNLSFFYNFFHDDYTRGRPHVGGDWDRHFSGLTLNQNFGDRISFMGSLGYRYDDLIHLYDKGKTNYAPNKKRYTDYSEIPTELRLTAKAGKSHTLTTGFFHNQTRTEQKYRDWFSHALIQENRFKVRTLAGYVNDVWKPAEPLTLTAGVRYDHWKNYDNMFSNYTTSNPEDRTDDSWSPKIGLRYNFENALSVWTNYGTGFKPPTSSELYDDRTSGGNPRQPNPNLKPEKTEAWEIGAEKWLTQKIQISIAGFYSITDDKILSWFDPANVWVNKNIGETRSYGTELDMAIYLDDHWSITANYTYNLATIEKNPVTPSQEGNFLPFSPKNKANLGITWEDTNNFTVTAMVRYLGEQFTNDKNTRENASGESLMMNDSLVVDLKAVKHVTVNRGCLKTVNLSVSVDNLFNDEYRSFYMYEDPGTVLSAQVEFIF